MALASDLINEAKGLTRESQSVTNATYLLWLSRNQRRYCRKANWPQLRVLNATLTTTANTAAYDLPAAFSRFMGEFALYDPSTVTNGYTGGTLLPILTQGGPQEDSKIIGHTANGSGTPRACYQRAKSGTPATSQMVLAPFPYVASKTVVYSYYADPAALTATSDTIPIASLQDTLTMALCREISSYLDNAEMAAYYGALEKAEWRTAMLTLNTL